MRQLDHQAVIANQRDAEYRTTYSTFQLFVQTSLELQLKFKMRVHQTVCKWVLIFVEYKQVKALRIRPIGQLIHITFFD